MIITCKPTGLSFHITRTWTTGDVGALANQIKNSKERDRVLPTAMMELISGEVVDPGPYKHLTAGGKMFWGDITHQDLVAACIQVRIINNHQYVHRTACEACGKLVRLEDAPVADLRAMETYRASDEGMEVIAQGNSLQITLDARGERLLKPSKDFAVIAFIKPTYCRELSALAQVQEKDPINAQDVALCYGISSIQTHEMSEPAVGYVPIRRVVDALPPQVSDGIDREIDLAFGGVDNIISWRCEFPDCGVEQEDVLPLDRRFFGRDLRLRRHRASRPSSGPLST